jgi:hypothetical protein
MNDVRSERLADRPLEAAGQGREQSRPTGSLHPPNSDISARFCPKSRSHTKQNIKPCLPGSRIAHFASPRPEELRTGTVQRDAQTHARSSLTNSLSNRELQLLEPTLTHRKEMIAPRSNRELSTNPCFRNSVLRSVWSVLTGFASQTESSVTHSKQTAETFLTGSRIARLAILNARFLTSENLMSRRRPIQIFLRPTI